MNRSTVVLLIALLSRAAGAAPAPSPTPVLPKPPVNQNGPECGPAFSEHIQKQADDCSTETCMNDLLTNAVAREPQCAGAFADMLKAMAKVKGMDINKVSGQTFEGCAQSFQQTLAQRAEACKDLSCLKRLHAESVAGTPQCASSHQQMLRATAISKGIAWPAGSP